MKGRTERRFRRINPGEVPSLAISAYIGYRSMDRQTESFVCLGLIVILLQNTGRSQAECSKRYIDAPGHIYDSLHSRNSQCRTHKSSCHYRICAPPDHFIVLNITHLSGTPLLSNHGCYPRVVVKNAGPGNSSPLEVLCNGERPLPRVLRSPDNELRVIFKSQALQTSSFQATFTFHKRADPPYCIVCPLVQQVNKSMNASFTLFPQNKSQNAPTEGTNGVPGDSTSSGAWHMEYFVLVVLAPLTVVCLCCVIMFYYRRNSRYASHSPSSLPNSSYSITSDNTQVPVSHSQSPLVSRRNRYSAQHQQEMLRKQREVLCPRESTEKFPTSVCLLDEDEPSHMRENVRIHREVMSENGIRAPPNRTVYDSERQDLLIQSQLRSKTENLQRHPVRRSPSSSSSKRGSVIRGGGGGGGGAKQGATNRTALPAGGVEAIDSETRSPLNLIDSDSEGPPPYASLAQINNNIINVCDSTVSTGNSTDGLLQSQQQQQMPCSPPYQPNSNGRFHGSTRGVGRGSSVRLKGTDCV